MVKIIDIYGVEIDEKEQDERALGGFCVMCNLSPCNCEYMKFLQKNKKPVSIVDDIESEKKLKADFIKYKSKKIWKK